MDEKILRLFEKIATVYSRDPLCLELLCCLAVEDKQDTHYQTIMSQVQNCLKESEDDRPIPSVAARLPNETGRKIYLRAVESEPLLALLRTAPLLSDAPPLEVHTLAQFADIQPHSDTMLYTRDRVFMRILNDLIKTETISVTQIVRQDLIRLIFVSRQYPGLIAALQQLAEREDWSSVMASLEADIEKSTVSQMLETRPTDDLARHLLLAIQDAQLDESAQRGLLGDAPRYSSMLRPEILAFGEVQASLPPVDETWSTLLPIEAKPKDIDTKIADEVLRQGLLPASLFQRIETSLELRIQVARHFLEMRKFVKLDSLILRWPEVASAFDDDRASVLDLEYRIIEMKEKNASPEALMIEIEDHWPSYKYDKKTLLRFFTLRPYLRDIPEFRQYLKVAQAVSQTMEVPSGVAQAAAGVPSVAAAKQAEVFPPFIDLFLTPKVKSNSDIATEYHMLLSTGSPVSTVASEVVKLDWNEIRETLAFPERMYTRVPEMLAVATPYIAQVRDYDVGSILKEIGTKIYEWFFVGSLSPIFEQLLEKDNYRIRIVLSDPRLMVLPWECLYVPALRMFPGLSRKYSLIRHIPEMKPHPQQPFLPPLRILALLSNPIDTPRLNVDQEDEILRTALQDALNSRRVVLEVLKDVTPETLQRTLRRFRPHVFHFVGHAYYDTRQQQGMILLTDDTGKARPISAADMATLLRDSQISIAVLNGCYTNVASSEDVFTGVSGALVNAGVPAIIGTIRAIADQAALRFAREFYLSLVDGYTAETALVEARKALSIEKMDWAAYGLVTGSRDLDSLRLVTEAMRQDQTS